MSKETDDAGLWLIGKIREYGMIYRGPDFIGDPPPSPVSELDRRHTGRLRKRDNLLT